MTGECFPGAVLFFTSFSNENILVGEVTTAPEEDAPIDDGNGTDHPDPARAIFSLKGGGDIVVRSNVKRESVANGPFNQIFLLFSFVASSCLGLAHSVYTRYDTSRSLPVFSFTMAVFFRLFYNHVFVQTLCHVLEHVSCVEQRRYTIAFSSTLHHANDKSSLRTMFDAYNGCRLGAATVLLVVSIHGQINANVGTIESKFLVYWMLKTSFLF